MNAPDRTTANRAKLVARGQYLPEELRELVLNSPSVLGEKIGVALFPRVDVAKTRVVPLPAGTNVYPVLQSANLLGNFAQGAARGASRSRWTGQLPDEIAVRLLDLLAATDRLETLPATMEWGSSYSAHVMPAIKAALERLERQAAPVANEEKTELSAGFAAAYMRLQNWAKETAKCHVQQVKTKVGG